MRFTVLGGGVGVITDAGETIPLGGPQQRRLLAGLLAEPGDAINTDRLIEMLWPDDRPPEGARRTVMTYVSRLRAAIGEGHVVTSDSGYALVLDGAEYDAAEFETWLGAARERARADALPAYDHALALWSGRAFGEDADEWWLRPVAVRLEELRLVAIEERVECLIDAGRHGDAVAELDGLVAEHPLRERFIALLMRALYLSGRQAEALRSYRRFVEYLADETGLEPSEALVDLERRITRGDPSLAPASGLAVPGYELMEVIGEGAFGSVYRASQPSIGREVAIKVVQPALADDPRFVRRFEAEAQLVARLEHPHVVPLYDFWRQPGGAYLVFRLLRGGSLADLVADGPLTLERATRLIDEIGGALDAAHALGIVHRDVKPANILFDEAGNSYLADFGIAVFASGEPDVDVRAGSDLLSAGSPLYASPEQSRDGVAGAASDQYALGVVLWEALTGRAPFTGSSTTELLRSKLGEPVPPISGTRADLPPALDAVLRRATAPHPADRYESTRAFTHAWGVAVVTAEPARTTGRLPEPDGARAASQTLVSVRIDGVNPYKGLRAFREADAGEFQGRAALVDTLAARVEAESFLAVVGPSGSGKSSLVHAGLVPALRTTGALVASMVPGTDPLGELEAALRGITTAADAGTLRDRLLTADGLVDVASDIVPAGSRLVLVVDQFEEMWTLVASEHARQRFVELLVRAASRQELVRVVVTLRADLYDRPLQHPDLGPLVRDHTFAVTPMSPSELHDAIVVPAERVGVQFERGLVATIVDDVVSRAGALPLLQFTLAELYERRASATVTADAYTELGGVGGALASRAEQLYSAADESARADIRRLFTRLVTPTDEGDDLRRRASLSELSDLAPDVSERFRASRLLVMDHHPITREPTVEVAHEALLREWPRLRGWIDEDRDGIRVRRMLMESAAEWNEHGHDASDLYRGARLAAADDVAALLPFSTVEHDFLDASRALADRERGDIEERAASQARQNRRLRTVLAATALFLAVALVAGAVALIERGNARDEARSSDQAAERADAAALRAEAGRLVAQSQQLAPLRPDLSMLLALEAARLQPGTQTSSAVLGSLITDPALLRYDSHATKPRVGIGLHTPDFSPDSQLVATPDPREPIVHIVESRSGSKVRDLVIPSLGQRPDVQQVLWPTDGLLIVIAREAFVGLDARTGAVRIPATKITGLPLDAAASPGGKWLAIPSDRTTAGLVTVYALPSGRKLFERRAPGNRSSATIGVGALDVDFAAAVAWRGAELYAGGGSGRIEQWDPTTGATARVVGLAFPAVSSMLFTPDGTRLFVSGWGADGTSTMAYDPAGGTPTWMEHPSAYGQLAYDPQHDAVVVSDITNDYRVRSYAAATGRSLDVAFELGGGSVCATRTSADGFLLAAVSCTQSIAIWALRGDGALLRQLAPPGPAVVPPHALVQRADPVGSAAAPVDAYSSDGGHLRLTSATGLLAVDTRTGEPTHVPGTVLGVYLPDGRVLFGEAGGQSGVSKRPITDLRKTFDADDVKPDGKAPIVFAGWNVAADRAAAGRRDGTLEVVELSSDHTYPTIHYGGGVIFAYAFNDDATRVFVTGLRNQAIAYDVATGKQVAVLGPGANVAIDAQRRLLMIGALDGTIAFYDTRTLRRVGPVIADNASYADVLRFTPDGRTAVVTNIGGEIRLYDVRTRTLLGAPITRSPNLASDVAITPDSRAVALSLPSGIAELTLDPEEWHAAACRAAGRNLTRAEWNVYLSGEPRKTCPQWAEPA